MNLLTAAQMRELDRMAIDEWHVPGLVLMENAGRGATAFFLETLYRHHPGAVGIVAGSQRRQTRDQTEIDDADDPLARVAVRRPQPSRSRRAKES